jgi:hypothetical protein
LSGFLFVLELNDARGVGYSVFGLHQFRWGLYKKHALKGLLPQEKSTFDFKAGCRLAIRGF